MNNLEKGHINRLLWETKYISGPDENWFISKVFKNKKKLLPIEEQKRIIEVKKQYFWEYIPKTELIEMENWEYIIRQKFIRWKTLDQIDVSNLWPETLSKLLDLIKKYLKYHKEQWWSMDVTWCQYHAWNPNIIKMRIMNFLKINKNFLVSTNIMIWDDWNVYMVDICESAVFRLQSRIKNFCSKPFIRRTIKKLEELLQQKINFEKERTNKELVDNLK